MKVGLGVGIKLVPL